MRKIIEAARAYCERHLGDVAGDYADEESLGSALYDEAYTLAHDGALSAGATMAQACEVAARVAQSYAQP